MNIKEFLLVSLAALSLAFGIFACHKAIAITTISMIHPHAGIHSLNSYSATQDLKLTSAQLEMVAYLQDISVTIMTREGSGSGVIMNRDGVCYVWTAGHVVSSCKRTRKVLDEHGQSKTLVEFDHVFVVKDIVENGRTVGSITSKAEIIRYSGPDFGHDLALLKLGKLDFVKNSVKFHLDNTIPANGTELYHVGSLLGPMGSCSVTMGIYSQQGRQYLGKIYDQTSCPAFPGSSGGGVFLKENGTYVGMLVRAAGETFNFIVPIRRMQEWAKKNNCMWALDNTIKVDDSEHAIENPEESDTIMPDATEGSIQGIPVPPHSRSHRK